MIWTGENYHQHIINEIKNPFWVSVAKSYKEWFKLLTNMQIYPTEFQPIWGNPMIRIPFNNTLYQKGLVFVSDFLNETGSPLSLASLQAKYDCHVMFTVYYALVNAISRIWKDELLTKPKTYNAIPPPPYRNCTNVKKGPLQLGKSGPTSRIPIFQSGNPNG